MLARINYHFFYHAESKLFLFYSASFITLYSWVGQLGVQIFNLYSYEGKCASFSLI